MAGSVPQLNVLSLFPIARYNRTSYFYPTYSESSEHSPLLVSPVLVASAVIGVVIILSCITIIVGSIRRDRQARLQRHRHRHRRHHHHHHHHRRRYHREYEQGYGELPSTRGPGFLSDCDGHPGDTGEGAALPGVGRGGQEEIRGSRAQGSAKVTLKVKGRVWCYSPALASVGPAVLTAGPAGTCMEGRRERGMGRWDGRTDGEGDEEMER